MYYNISLFSLALFLEKNMAVSYLVGDAEIVLFLLAYLQEKP